MFLKTGLQKEIPVKFGNFLRNLFYPKPSVAASVVISSETYDMVKLYLSLNSSFFSILIVHDSNFNLVNVNHLLCLRKNS